MSALQELIREQAQRLGQPEVKMRLDQWLRSAQSLLQQLEAWLKEADPEGILKVTKAPHELREENFGAYELWRLKIDLGGRRVEIVPLGGNVGGAVRLENNQTVAIRGMVEMVNDIDRIRLFRLIDDRSERWVIQHSGPWPAKPLDQTTFEAAMLQLLS